MAENFIPWSLEDIIPGEPLPAPCFLYLGERYIRYRHPGDAFDRMTYDRMLFKKVTQVYIREADEAAMRSWLSSFQNANTQDLPVSEEIKETRAELRRSVMDIFHSNHPNEIVTKTLKTSEKLVTELMKFPFASKPLQQLQTYSRGTVDHSVNVSVLSVYLAMNMGYSHVLILRHLACGALLHDLGKGKIEISDGEDPEAAEYKMRSHPELGFQILNEDESISKEVKMIVMQHHECHDGSGYPKGLRGKEIYDLAKIVSIANVFDSLVSEMKGPLDQRQKQALEQLSGPMAHQFDPSKLQKTIKILSLGV